MPSGIYLRTPEMRIWKLTPEHRKKVSLWNLKFGRKGKDCNFWKGGISRNYKRGYRDKRFKNWRTEVFLRDNFTCQKCGAFGCYVTAHHIKSFAYFPDLRYEVGNGMTLCEPCHMKTDNYKGRGGKTKCVPAAEKKEEKENPESKD